MTGMIRIGVLTIVGLLPTLAIAQAQSQKTYNFEHPHIRGELIIKFKSNVGVNTTKAFARLNNLLPIKQFRSSGAVHFQMARVPESTKATSRFAQNLARSSLVEFIEANTILTIDAEPDDPQLGDLWGMNKINAQSAWNVSTGSRSIIVGVIDTGVDYTHPDISANYWHNPGEMGRDDDGEDKSTNGKDDDGNGYIDDFRGWDFVNDDNDPKDDHNHGTHCAGTIAAVGNNSVGVAGVAWEASVVGLKFLTWAGGGSLSDAVEAIEYATMMGFHMTSNSWGGDGRSLVMWRAIREARDAGILFIAAAGNDGIDNDRFATYPASYPLDNIIAVAASDASDTLADFSNFGDSSVDLAAPGVEILSTVRNGRYKSYSGTSMAAPHVAGALVLIFAANPGIDADKAKQRLLGGVDTVAAMNSSVATGGRLNVARSLTVVP